MSKLRPTLVLAVAAFLAAAAAASGPGTASAAGTVNCAPYGSATAADVQAAAASGGTVTIRGICQGTLTLSGAVTLRGGTTGATSGLDGNGSGPVVKITGGPVSLANLLVENGACACAGAGVSIDHSVVNLVGARVLNNHATSFGGGVYAENAGTVNVSGSTISGNVGRYDGGGLMMNGGSDLSISGSTVAGNSLEENYGGLGGGVSQFGAQLTVNASTFSGNHAPGSGGAIAVQYGTAAISHATLEGNSAGFFGGGIFTGDVNDSGGHGVAIAGSSMDHNTAGDGGGALYNESFFGDSNVTATNTAFTANSASFGGAVHNSAQGATAGFSGSGLTFLANHANSGQGGAIYNEAIYDVSVGLVTLSGSTIGPSIGTPANANTAQEGGGIYNFVYPGSHGNATVTLTGGSAVSHNTAFQTGGGVYTCSAGTLNLQSGGHVLYNTPNNVFRQPC